MLARLLPSHVLTVVTALAAVLMALSLLQSRRTPQSLLAWLLGLVFAPLVTIPLYLLLGGRKLPRPSASSGPRRGPEPVLPPACSPVEAVLRSEGVAPARGGHAVEVIGSGETAYHRLRELIAFAERTIRLSMFIVGDDETGRSIIDALAAKARAGVRVEVIVDAVGSSRVRRYAARALEEAGGELRVFMPLLHVPVRGRSNLRSHRKLAIFDSEVLFAGGMNLAREYMGPTPREGRWRDVAAVVTGPVALDAERLFVADWLFATRVQLRLPRLSRLLVRRRVAESTPSLPALGADTAHARGVRRAGSAVVQLVPSGPDQPYDTFYDALLTALGTARRSIVAVTPYYVADDTLQRAFALAARRGVRTTLVLPQRSNHAFADYARRGLLRELEASGVDVRLFVGGMVHAKALAIDDSFAYVGSPNLDMRSLFLNYENALCIYSPAEVAVVRAYAEALAAESAPHVPSGGAPRWFLEQMARLFAPEL